MKTLPLIVLSLLLSFGCDKEPTKAEKDAEFKRTIAEGERVLNEVRTAHDNDTAMRNLRNEWREQAIQISEAGRKGRQTQADLLQLHLDAEKDVAKAAEAKGMQGKEIAAEIATFRKNMKERMKN